MFTSSHHAGASTDGWTCVTCDTRNAAIYHACQECGGPPPGQGTSAALADAAHLSNHPADITGGVVGGPQGESVADAVDAMRHAGGVEAECDNIAKEREAV